MQDRRGLSALVYMGKYSFSNWFKIMHVAFHESHLLFYCYYYYFDCLKRYCFKFYENKTFGLEVKKTYIVTLKKNRRKLLKMKANQLFHFQNDYCTPAFKKKGEWVYVAQRSCNGDHLKSHLFVDITFQTLHVQVILTVQRWSPAASLPSLLVWVA